MKKILIILIILFILSIVGWLLLNRQQSQKITVSQPTGGGEKIITTPTPVESAEVTIKRKYNKLLELKRTQDGGLSKVAAVEQTNLDSKTIAELNKLDEYMHTEGTTYADVEIVTIFFDNIPNARYSYEERKDRALEAITQVREAISKGQITMEQAASKLKNRTDMNDIDTAWEGNVYTHIPYAKKNEKTTVDANINELVWSQPVGELSQPQVFQNENTQNLETAKIDVGYMIIKVNKREQKELDSYYDFMKAD
jgi:hypothetical protein